MPTDSGPSKAGGTGTPRSIQAPSSRPVARTFRHNIARTPRRNSVPVEHAVFDAAEAVNSWQKLNAGLAEPEGMGYRALLADQRSKLCNGGTIFFPPLTVFHHQKNGEGSERESTQMTTAYSFFSAWVTCRVRDDRGATLVEYALLVALIGVVCVTALTLLGGTASDKFSEVSSAIDD